jgi:hypothetical protein
VSHLRVSPKSESPRSAPEEVTIVVFPEDPVRWKAVAVHRETVTVSSAGILIGSTGQGSPAGYQSPSVTAGPLAPGVFLVAAVRDPDHSLRYYLSQSVLERLHPLATPIKLAGGEDASISTAIIGLPE